MRATFSRRAAVPAVLAFAAFGGATFSANRFASALWGILSAIFAFRAVDAALGALFRRRGVGARRAFAVLSFGFGAFFIAAVGVREISPLLLFFPNRDDAARDALSRFPKAERITIPTEFGDLSGWILRDPSRAAAEIDASEGATAAPPLLLYFGGNAENASRRALESASNPSVRAPFAGWDVAVFDYPGYGESAGKPSEASFKRFGLAVFDALKRRAPRRIVLYGYSIGTGVANFVASRRPVDGLILAAPYADGFDLFNDRVPIFFGPLKALVPFPMESAKFAETVGVRPLIFATPDDRLVPFESSVRLAERYPLGADFRAIDGIDHNGFWNSSVVRDEIARRLACVAARE